MTLDKDLNFISKKFGIKIGSLEYILNKVFPPKDYEINEIITQ